ncbi:MAG: metallophosphoesterase [bacterium]
MMNLISSIRNIAIRRHLKERALVWKMFIPPGKYALIGDNHGFLNIYRETVYEIMERHPDIKGVFHLGDMFGANAPLDECVECLRFTIENRIIAIKGNHCRNVLNCDTKHKYSPRKDKYNRQLYELLIEQPDLYKKMLRFPDKIENDYFELVHSSVYRPYYSNTRYSNEFCVTYDLVSRPVFASHEHRFQMTSKSGIGAKRSDLVFDEDIPVDTPCIISVPTMTYSRERQKYEHGYTIITIRENGALSIHAYHMGKSFTRQEPLARENRSQNQIAIKDIEWN